MTYLYEVAMRGAFGNKALVNVWHVADPTELETPSSIATAFDGAWAGVGSACFHSTASFTEIVVKPMDSINPANPHALTISRNGTGSGEAAIRGIHAFIRLATEDNFFRPGGKLFGGLSENFLDNGLLVAGYVTNVTAYIDAIIAAMDGIGCYLAVYRPSLSTPGNPEFSEVTGFEIVRGSVNNRRMGTSELPQS